MTISDCIVRYSGPFANWPVETAMDIAHAVANNDINYLLQRLPELGVDVGSLDFNEFSRQILDFLRQIDSQQGCAITENGVVSLPEPHPEAGPPLTTEGILPDNPWEHVPVDITETPALPEGDSSGSSYSPLKPPTVYLQPEAVALQPDVAAESAGKDNTVLLGIGAFLLALLMLRKSR